MEQGYIAQHLVQCVSAHHIGNISCYKWPSFGLISRSGLNSFLLVLLLNQVYSKTKISLTEFKDRHIQLDMGGTDHPVIDPS